MGSAQVVYNNFELLGIYLEAFYFGKSFFNHVQLSIFSKKIQHYPIPGLYSGIFVLYLYLMSNKDTNSKTSKFTFYLLCILYFSSLGIVFLDAAQFIYNVGNNPVHNNDPSCRANQSRRSPVPSVCNSTFLLVQAH